MVKKGDIIHNGEDYGRVIETSKIVDLKALNIKSFEELLEYFHKLEPNPKRITVEIEVLWEDDEE